MANSNWKIAHASAIGLAHLNQQTECQDRLQCKTVKTKNDGEVLIAVVADGAGSTTDGQIGAELACKLFVKELSGFLKSKDASINSLTLEFGRFWLSFFQKEIEKIAAKNGKQVREYASTLVGAVVGNGRAAFYQMGDGGIVVSASGNPESYKFAILPEEVEYVNTTDFLTDEAAIDRLRFETIEGKIEDIILFSDGIFPVAVDYQNSKPHEPFLLPMIAPLRDGMNGKNNLNEKLESFLSSPKINEKTDDDKTIILASRGGN
jgi:serine/threonine protein phosphatase PrpC